MKKLIQGIVDFRLSLSEESRSLFAKLALGQKPDALFIGCSDSRVAPNVFASTNPGDLFVVRNLGNLVPPEPSRLQECSVPAALEFAVFNLNVSDIIVCGHSECGAIQAIVEGIDSHSCPHLQSWLKLGKAALEKVQSEGPIDPSLSKCNQVSQANVLLQMEHISSYPYVRERMETKKLRLHGWWFDIARADVYSYEPHLHRFVLIDEEEAKQILERLR